MQGLSLPAGTAASTVFRRRQECWVTVARHAAADDDTVKHVERRGLGRGAVAEIAMCHRPGFFEWGTGLGVIDGLDLVGPLCSPTPVHGQHHHVVQQRYVEADNGLQLAGKVGITAALEDAWTVRLRLVRDPDPLRRTQRNACRLGHRSSDPVDGLAGLLALVPQQPLDPGLAVALLLALDRRATDPGAMGYRRRVGRVGRKENDPRTGDALLRFQSPIIVASHKRSSAETRRQNV